MTATSPAVRAAVGGAKTALPKDHFFIGDCLPVLAELTAKHGAFADLVYLDPPFNSARLYNHAFTGVKRTLPQKVAFTDTWRWTDATKNDFREFTEKESPQTDAAEFLSAMRSLLEKRDPSTLAYLTYMTRRLARIRAAMKPAASVYLHCDPTASHYLKLAMDSLFGRKNFRNEIIWYYYNKYSAGKRIFARNFDSVLFYSKDARYLFTPLREPRDKPVKQLLRENVAGVLKNKKGADGKTISRVSTDKKMDAVWRIPCLQPAARERLGYQTQKPLALLRRIITASSNPGDLVLDPFCGCGTTIEAANELGRRFVGIDIARSAAQVIARRMEERAGFGKLIVGDKTPSTLRGWGRILPDDAARADAPEWARFQYDAIAAIPKAEQIESAIQRTAKQGGDGGIDGLIHLERPNGTRTSVIIQVKRKKTPSMGDVADTLLAVDGNDAFMGLLITLNPPTAGMRARGGAEKKRFNGAHYPKVAILTYEEVKAGKFADVIPYEYAVDPQGGKQTALA